jgi:gliding motility-associated lipoprotein GldD
LKFKSTLFIGLALIMLTSACDEDEEFLSPKPRGYFRIDFPEKKYKLYDSLCPYSFEIPDYSQITQNKQSGAEPCWQNLDFNTFHATVYLSYKEIHNDLSKYLDDAHEFANRHQIKASGLEQIAVIRDSAKVYGLLFDIEGNSASSVQFYLTDSTQHFLRGSLYFNCVPNADSLKIVIDFLKKDIYHLINTTRWKS